MGLRAKLIAALLLVFGCLGAVIITTAHVRIGRSYEAIEYQQARDDMYRLAEAVESALVQLDDSVLEWASWSELYEFMKSRDPAFRKETFSFASIRQARFLWLGVYDERGRLLAHVGQDPDAHAPAALPILEQKDNPLTRALSASMRVGFAQCGLIRLDSRVYGMCRRAITDSQSRKPPRGVVVILKEIGTGFMTDIGRQTKLNARLEPFDESFVFDPQTEFRMLPSRLGNLSAHAHAAPDRYVFHWPLQDLRGQKVALLTLDWSRRISVQGRQTLWEMVGLFSSILGVGALLMLLIVDRLVVARMGRLALRLQAICLRRDWGGRTRDSRNDEIGHLSRRTNELLSVIQDQVHELEQSSLTDPLTGLANRRRLDAVFSNVMARYRRQAEPLSLAAIDVDCFKRFNDGYGHVQGDAALRDVAECLKQAQREGDLPCRVGGEEFLLLLPDCSEKGARVVAERFREILRQKAIPHAFSDAGPLLSVSVGIAQMRADDTPESFCIRADRAMYHAKATGRDRVVVFDEMDET